MLGDSNAINQSSSFFLSFLPFPPLSADVEVSVLVDVLVALTEVLVDIEVLEDKEDALETDAASVEALVGNDGLVDVGMVDDAMASLVDVEVMVAVAAATLVDFGIVVAVEAAAALLVELGIVVAVEAAAALVDSGVVVAMAAAAALDFDNIMVVVVAALIVVDVTSAVGDASMLEERAELDGVVVREDVAAGLGTMVGAAPLIDSIKIVDAMADAVCGILIITG
jgi:hypothetical protein